MAFQTGASPQIDFESTFVHGIQNFKISCVYLHRAQISEFSPSRHLFLGTHSGELLYFDFSTKSTHRFAVLKSEITKICYYLDPQQKPFLVICGGNKSCQVQMICLHKLLKQKLKIVSSVRDFNKKVLDMDILRHRAVFGSECYRLGLYSLAPGDRPKFQPLWNGQVSASFVNCVSFAQDAESVFFGNHSKSLFKFDCKSTSIVITKSPAAKRALYDAHRLSPAHLVTSSSDSILRIWAAHDLSLLHEIDLTSKLGPGDTLCGGQLCQNVFFGFTLFGDLVSVDVRQAMSGRGEEMSWLRVLSTGKPVRVVEAPNEGFLVLDSTGKLFDPLRSEVLAHVQKTVYSGDFRDTVLLIATAKYLFGFDIQKKAMLSTKVSLQGCFPECVRFVDDDRFVVASSNKLRLYGSGEFRVLKEIQIPDRHLTCLCLWNDQIVLGTKRGKILTCAVDLNKGPKEITSNDYKITSLGSLRNGSTLGVGNSQGLLKAYSLDNLDLVAEGVVQTVGVTSMESVDEDLLVTTGAEMSGSLFSLSKNKTVFRFNDFPDALCFAFRRHGSRGIYFFGMSGIMSNWQI